MLSQVRKLLENNLERQKNWLWYMDTVSDTNENNVMLGSLGATVEGVVELVSENRREDPALC